MILYIFGYEDFINAVIFFQFWVPFPPFWNNRNFDFFSNIYFLIRISENLSTYSYYECLQLKNTEFAVNASGKSAKNLGGKLPINVPHTLTDTFFWQTKVFGSSEVKTKHLWQWALVLFECHPHHLALLLYVLLWTCSCNQNKKLH